MTPELIRAAEEMCHCETPTMSVGFAANALHLAYAVLEHRKDFDENGEELPVDPEFCREMGMTLQSDGWSVPFYELLLRDIAISWWPETQSLSLGDSILHEPMTRPQLRKLLSALGVGGAA